MNQGSTLHIVTGGWGYEEQQERNIYPNAYAYPIEIESFLQWWGGGVIGYQDVGNLIMLYENVNADDYVRTLPENLLDSVE